MQPTIEILDRIRKNSRDNKEEIFTRLYRYLLRPDLYYLAYKNLYANKGAGTKGVNDDMKSCGGPCPIFWKSSPPLCGSDLPGSGPAPFPGYLDFWTLCPEVGKKMRTRRRTAALRFVPVFLHRT